MVACSLTRRSAHPEACGRGHASHIVGVVVDGAAVTAVSEGRDVRELAAELLKDVLAAFERDE